MLIDKCFKTLGHKCKLVVDLIFSMECSLKAIIFLETQCDEIRTYEQIRHSGHNLKKMAELIQTHDDRFMNLKNFINELPQELLEIANRYSLEASICFRTEGFLSPKYDSTFKNPMWIEQFFEKAKDLQEYALNKIKPSLSARICRDSGL